MSFTIWLDLSHAMLRDRCSTNLDSSNGGNILSQEKGETASLIFSQQTIYLMLMGRSYRYWNLQLEFASSSVFLGPGRYLSLYFPTERPVTVETKSRLIIHN